LKKLLTIICLSLLISGQAFAQFYGQLSTPEPVKAGNSRAGVYIGLFDDATAVISTYRYGLGGYTDLGFKLGIDALDQEHGDDTGIDLNCDIKYQAMDMNLRDPINLSVGGLVDFFKVDYGNVFSLGGYAIGSYPVKLRNGHVLEPYGRLLLRMERTSPDHGDADTDFEIGFNMGSSFDISKTIRAYGELQFDENFGFLLGMDFDF
jgi:hypothetical protein